MTYLTHMPHSEPDFSVSEAAEESGIPRRTIQWAIKNEHLRARQMFGKTGAYLIKRADFTAWADSRQGKAS